MASERWHDLGAVSELKTQPLRQIVIGRTRLALSFWDGRFGAISGACSRRAREPSLSRPQPCEARSSR